MLLENGKDSDGLIVPTVTRTSPNPFIDDFDLLAYWQEPARVELYPRLSIHAARVQVILASSNICERVSDENVVKIKVTQ